jgi:benzoate transport
MTLGALFIAPLADRIGRERLILLSAVIMGGGVLATSVSTTVNELMFLRFVSGLGIGAMLASASTLASEYAPHRSKDLWVSLVMGGYSMGAVLSGLAASFIIPEYGWRVMFQVAGVATLAAVPVIIFLLPPSLEYLITIRPKDALTRANRILVRMGIEPLAALPETGPAPPKASVRRLLTAARRTQTLLLWLAFFMAFSTLYFLTAWIPRLTTTLGLSERLGIYAGTVFNLGAFVGVVILGSLAIRLGLRKTILIFLSSAAAIMMVFGLFSGSAMILVLFGLIGLSMQGGFIGLYPLAARLYPVEIRATGIGWAIGAGRIGAVVGPIAAGYLMGAGFSVVANFVIFAVPCAVAGVAAMLITADGVS